MTEMSISNALALAQQHFQAGRLSEAEAICRHVLDGSPQEHRAFRLLGIVAYHAGKLEEAKNFLEQAISLNPHAADYYDNLCLVLKSQKKFKEAEIAARQALSIMPNLAEAELNLGIVLHEQGRVQEALQAYQRALAIRPNFAPALNNQGIALKELGFSPEAVISFQRALAIEPDHAEAWNNLGITLRVQGKMEASSMAFRRALEINPNYGNAEKQLAITLTVQGRLKEAIDAFGRALEIEPNDADAHSKILYAMHFSPGITLSALWTAHSEWDKRYAEPLKSTWRPFENDTNPNRRLRIGFVSGVFGKNPVGFFTVRVLEALDPQKCDTVCYYDRFLKDSLTDRIEAAAENWNVVCGLSDEDLSEQIRREGIDILIDLTGHVGGNRLMVFARKPAPIQVSWLGYMGTTGLAAMDYLVADRFQVPEEAKKYYREKIIWMPDGCFCYDPPISAPKVGPLPAIDRGFVTFGSFNQLTKYTPQVVDLWVKILEHLPEARLVLKYLGFEDESTRQRITELFATQGIDPVRLILLGKSPHDKLLAFYNQIDIALDPFPFSGNTTTCEALWMGVPVVTCPGETFASRHSLCQLSVVRLTETIAKDFDEYVEIAVNLAQDLPRLSNLRAGLRQRMANSPLCDGKRFAENLMKALRGVWREWCETANENESRETV